MGHNLELLWQDLRYGARMLLKQPGFTLIAVLTLALGTGANTAIFSIVNATLLRSLSYPNADQIVMVWGTNPAGFGWHGKTGFSAPNFLDYQQQSKVFAHMGTFNSADFTLTGVDTPERIQGARVTAAFFSVLEVKPMLGRTFLPEEEQAGQDHVAVLSYGLWQRRFGSDANIIGQAIRLDATSYTVVGVLPQSFDFSIPEFFESKGLWVPAVISRNEKRSRNYLSVIARLRPGVTLREAQGDLGTITDRLKQEYASEMGEFGTKLVPLHEEVVGSTRPVLWLLFGTVGLVLMIACANVANLQLARASTRQKEMAIRATLGASRGRLLRQLLTESALLAVIGGALGVLLASWGNKLLISLGLTGIPRKTNVTIDSVVLLYSLVLSLVTGILCGLAPALQAAPTRLAKALKAGGKLSTSTSSGNRLRNMLMIAEVALSLILLIGAGLLIRSFVRLLRVDPGFETTNILTLSLNLPRYAYPTATRQAEFYTQLMERVKALPGVIAVGATNDLPPTKSSDSDSISIEGQPPLERASEQLAVEDRLATPDYFRVMGIPLIAGRAFSEADISSASPVVVVNQTFARRFFPNENPIGRHLKFGEGASAGPWITIVGVVGDVRGFGLDKQPNSEIYLSYQQQNFLPYNPLSHMYLVARTTNDPDSLAASVLGVVRALDKDLPLPQAQTMESYLAASIAERRSNMFLLGMFAMLAMILAGVGIYGVISYSVTQRTHEIGVRVALGAQSRDVVALVVGKGMKLALSGIAIGLGGAVALTRWMANLLYGVTPTDVVTFTAVPVVLLVVAFIACYVPARRATKVDPMVALRHE
jgi:putative ABC transport system permease protein